MWLNRGFNGALLVRVQSCNWFGCCSWGLWSGSKVWQLWRTLQGVLIRVMGVAVMGATPGASWPGVTGGPR